MAETGVVFTLITIIFGLMLTDLFASVHRLIRHRRRVRWHWLSLVVAWYVLAMILKNWWSLVRHQEDAFWTGGWIFFFYGHLLLLLYLVASAVLPDEIPEEGLDLRDFYFETRRQFWGLLAGVNLILLLATLLRPILFDQPHNWPSVASNVVMGLIAVSLAWTRNRVYHSVVVVVLVMLILFELIQKFTF